MPVTTADKRATFRKLHQSGCFVLPNPWDVGSARALQHLGFKAVASTSAGFAWSIGKADNRVTLEDVLQHLTELCGATDLPVNADFEGGFAHEAEKVGGQCRARGQDRRCRTVDRGFHRRRRKAALRARPRDRAHQGGAGRDRCRQQRRAADRPLRRLSGRPRRSRHGDRPAQGLCGCRRGLPLRARHQDQGTDLGGREGRAPKAGQSSDRRLRAVGEGSGRLGVRRISVGGSLARTAWAGFMRSAREMAEKGTFAELANGYPGGELNKMFG